VQEGEAGIGGAESWQGAALVRVKWPLDLVMAHNLTVITRSRICEMGLRRIMMRKEAGES